MEECEKRKEAQSEIIPINNVETIISSPHLAVQEGVTVK